MKTYDQDVLAEEFIPGREFAAFVFHAINKKVYIIERVFSGQRKNRYKFLDFDLVWNAWREGNEAYFAKLGYKKYHELQLSRLVKKAFGVVHMEDYGKFDIRRDSRGRYYFIDSNPNCYFAPPEELCDLSMTMKLYGVTFKTLLKRMLINTMQEWAVV